MIYNWSWNHLLLPVASGSSVVLKANIIWLTVQFLSSWSSPKKIELENKLLARQFGSSIKKLYFENVEAKLDGGCPSDDQNGFGRRWIVVVGCVAILNGGNGRVEIGQFDSHLAWFIPFWPDHDRHPQTCQRADLPLGVGSGQNFGQVSRPQSRCAV